MKINKYAFSTYVLVDMQCIGCFCVWKKQITWPEDVAKSIFLEVTCLIQTYNLQAGIHMKEEET